MQRNKKFSLARTVWSGRANSPHNQVLARLVFFRSARRLLVTASVVLVPLMKEALSSFETSVLARATWRNIPEDAILHSDRRETRKSYITLTGWTL
jgi:hypothetical protein